MGILKQAGNDLDLGTFVPSKVIVNSSGWYDSYDNGAATTLPIVLDTTKLRRKAERKCIVTLGATTNVTCAAATQTIGLGAGKVAGDYLLTLTASIDGVIAKLEICD